LGFFQKKKRLKEGIFFPRTCLGKHFRKKEGTCKNECNFWFETSGGVVELLIAGLMELQRQTDAN